MRLELLMLVGQFFSTPDTTPRRNLEGDVPTLLPRRARDLFALI
jgi:hypothetical protein